jgi:hypothetical protein
MEIILYSDFPEGDLKNLNNLGFPAKVIAGAKSLSEFKRVESRIKESKNVTGVGYWPTLSRDEGYWISPWSNSDGLDRIFGQIEEREDKSQMRVLLDLEPPYLVKKKQMLTGLRGFGKKKQKIKQFIERAKQNNIQIVSAELPRFVGSEYLQRLCGIAYDPNEIDYEKVKMAYTSLMTQFGIPRNQARQLLEREARIGHELFGNKFGIGLGCTAKSGLKLDERILTPQELREDLEIIQNEGIEKAYIYSLRGLTPDYAEVLAGFTSSP